MHEDKIPARQRHTHRGHIGRTLAESLPDWPAPRQAPARSPNVVVILLDDLGYSDFGCFGGEIRTPHVDALAAGGLRFMNYTTVPMCTPARAALLTGKNPHSVGCGWLTHNDPGYPGYRGEIALDTPTMAEILRSHGYTTMAAGKWHNTYDRNAFAGGDTGSWPVQRGFDRFYGFLSAETSYFQPDNMLEGNQPVNVEQRPPGYFAPDDYTQRAMDWLTEHHGSSPQTPFFLYLAFQAPHGPHHAKPEDMARYQGLYDEGWDSLRAARHRRQQQEGLTETNARFAGRNPGVPAWESLAPEDRALYARYMEAYAALVDNTDQNIGRLVAHLRTLGVLDNTIIVVTSDNGANGTGGETGTMNLLGRRQGQDEDMALNRRLATEGRLGSDVTYPVYPAGWAQLSNTPYRMYKRTPMAGGIRVPFVFHWPDGIAPGERGAMRRQWIHVTDILPTLLEISGAARQEVFNGYRTRALDGSSFAALVHDAHAPCRRAHQYYELNANRGFIEGRWKIVSLHAPRQPLRLDNWMLFDLQEDPTETCDLAAEKPDILQALVRRFEAEATANYVYPLDERGDVRHVSVPPHEVARMLLPRTFHPGASSVHGLVLSPMMADRGFRLQASFHWRRGDNGVVFSLGDRFNGMVLYVDGDALHFVYQWWFSPLQLDPLPLTREGDLLFTLDYTALGARKGQGSFTLDTRPWRSDAPLSPTFLRFRGGLDLGLSRGMAVSESLEGRGAFRYGGRVHWLRIDPGAPAPDTTVELDEAALQARMRGAVHRSVNT